MSKFLRSADASHRLSLAAMEEASRVGLRTADIEHLLLALTIDRDRAGSVLRHHGLTLDSTRAAIAAQHVAHLAALGVSIHEPAAGRIVFHETDGYAWSARAQRIFTNANARGNAGDAVAVLRELLAEPSGLIESVLHEAGANRASVELDLADSDSTRAVVQCRTASRPSSALAGTTEAFIPAPIAEVWELLADPARIPEWDPSVASVDTRRDPAEFEVTEAGAGAGAGADCAGEAGAAWRARATTTRPDGTTMKVAPAFQRLRIERLARDPERHVVWNFAFPDSARANSRTIDLRLEPDPGGTRLRIAFSWDRAGDRPRRHRLLGFLLRPLYRVVIWVQLSQLVSGISRVFR